jgi:hypothetical protein
MTSCTVLITSERPSTLSHRPRRRVAELYRKSPRPPAPSDTGWVPDKRTARSPGIFGRVREWPGRSSESYRGCRRKECDTRTPRPWSTKKHWSCSVAMIPTRFRGRSSRQLYTILTVSGLKNSAGGWQSTLIPEYGEPPVCASGMSLVASGCFSHAHGRLLANSVRIPWSMTAPAMDWTTCDGSPVRSRLLERPAGAACERFRRPISLGLSSSPIGRRTVSVVVPGSSRRE